MSDSPPKTRSLVLEAHLPGTPDELARMLTDPTEPARWFAPFVEGPGAPGALVTFRWSPDMVWKTRPEIVEPGRAPRDGRRGVRSASGLNGRPAPGRSTHGEGGAEGSLAGGPVHPGTASLPGRQRGRAPPLRSRAGPGPCSPAGGPGPGGPAGPLTGPSSRPIDLPGVPASNTFKSGPGVC